MSDETTANVTSGTEAQATSGATTETSGSVEGKQQTTTETQSASDKTGEQYSADFVQKLKKELENYRSKSKTLEMEKAEAEGRKDDVIKTLKDELTSLKAKEVNNMRAQVANQVKAKAAEMGCLKPKFLMSEIDVDQFEVDPSTLEIVNKDQLSNALEAFRRENPFMFKQSGPNLKDGVPGNKPISGGQNDLSKMSTKEIIEMARKQEMSR